MKKATSALMLILPLISITALMCFVAGESWVSYPSDLLSISKTWTAFGSDRSPAPPRVNVLESNEQKCSLCVMTYGMYREIVRVDEGVFAKLTLPDHGSTGEVGKPQLPAVIGLIEIPPGKSVRLAAMELDYCELEDYHVYPRQESAPRAYQEAETPEFKIDAAAYSSSSYYPDSLASLSLPAQMRDHTVIQLSVHTVRFNPALNKVRASTNVRIDLEYYDKGKPSTTRLERLTSTVFDKVCSAAIWNFGKRSITSSGNESLGYLIISNDTFYSTMTPFVNWKIEKGLSVTSVRLSDIGSNINDSAIFNFISHAFHNWTLPPTYVLLVGDVDYVPTHYGAISQSWPKVGVPTDHYFSCVEGTDYLPDLFVGRLSVKNITELNNVLDKIMGYNGFHKAHVTFMAGGGFESWCDWHCDEVVSQGYGIDKLYETFGNATIQNFIQTVRRSSPSVIFYDGHGMHTHWETSGFGTPEVYQLYNVNYYRYPIVLSDACLTGDFEHEHDSEYEPEVDCLGEAWMKAPNKGAVAFMGSSDVASGDLSDLIFRGFWRGLFNDQIEEFGPLMVAGKIYLYNNYYEHPGIPLHFDLYNILTDPQLELDPFRSRAVPTEYPTIQEAINHAKEGETIYIGTGTYSESIVVNKTLSLAGEDRYSTRIVSSGPQATVRLASRNIQISGLTIDGRNASTDGLYVSSNGNSIVNNVIMNNHCGICLNSSNYNIVFHNDLLDNTQNAHLVNSFNNLWDNGYEGNFWDSYSGMDADGDGIGDEPHSIDGSNTDYYPLINPYWNPADINRDLEVDIYDVVLISGAYASTPSKSNWNPHCDIAEPYGVIDIYDVVAICECYGEEYEPV